MAEILRRAIGLLAGNGVSKALLLGAELYLAWKLGAGSYGLFAVCLAVLLVAGQISLLGMDAGVVRFLAMYQEQRRPDRIAGLLRSSLGMAAGTGALAALFVVLASHAMARSVFGKPELGTALMLVGLAIPFEALNQCMAAIFRGVRRVPEQVLVSDLIRNVALGASLAIAPWMRLDLEYLAAALLFGTLASFATGIVALARHFRGLPSPGPVRAIARDLLAFSWPLFVWSIFQKLAGRVQVLIAAVFLSSTEVGVLALLFRVVLVFNFVQTAMNHAAPVEFARLSHLMDHTGLRRLFLRLSQVLLAISILLVLPIVIEPTVALRAFGGQYAEAAPLLLWLAVIQVLEVGSGPIGHLLINTGHQRSLVVVAMAGSLIQLSAAVLLTRLYGLPGAVAAEVATATFLMAARHALSSRLLGIHAFTPRFFGLLALGAASALVGVGMLRIEAEAVPYWAALATAVLVYGASLRWIFLGGPAGRADFARVARDVWRRPARTDFTRWERVEESPVVVADREILR